jgi:hypothetical protein
MDKREEASEKFLRELKEAGSFEAYEAKQRVTNPNFFQSGINEMPDLAKLRNTKCASDT